MPSGGEAMSRPNWLLAAAGLSRASAGNTAAKARVRSVPVRLSADAFAATGSVSASEETSCMPAAWRISPFGSFSNSNTARAGSTFPSAPKQLAAAFFWNERDLHVFTKAIDAAGSTITQRSNNALIKIWLPPALS